jgi:phosphoglycerol transferase MdoB-like AlkP superfamily enzyme
MRVPKLSKRRKYWGLSGLFLAVAAIFLMWFLEYRAFVNDAGRAWEFVEERAEVFWYSVFLVFLILVFLTGVTRRPAVAVGILMAIIIAVTYAHINKYRSRGAPLLPEDFQLASEAASLSRFIDVWGLVRMGVAAVLTIVLAVGASRWATKHFELTVRGSWWRRWAVVSRVAMIVLSVVIFTTATDFVRNHHGQRREDIEWLNTQFVAWNQVENYEKNGFLLGILYNLQIFKLEEPEGYSEEKMSEIKAKYEKIAKTENRGRVDLAEEGVNVLIVLNESFYDPTIIEEYYPHTGGDITPNLHRIQKKYPHGFMYSTDYGGGTANIEFEVLTGLTNYWANTVPYTDILPKRGEMPSIATWLRGQKYDTTAIHPFNGTMYKRDMALVNLGFDSFITATEMKYTERDGASEYINDRAAYAQLLDQLDTTRKSQLITLITMQNHMPYNAENYEYHDFELADMEDAGRKSEIETYYQSLYNSDKYLGELIEALDTSEKKVVLLFFGDHSAGLFDRTNGSAEKEIRDLSRMTPYFVYSNFEVVAEEGEMMTRSGGAAGRGGELPMTTPNCLSNTMFNAVEAKKAAIYYLLDKVCAETPVLANAYFGDEAPAEVGVLKEYKLVNYDLLGGKKYWAE